LSITIHDVARHAGVSVATVSRVLNSSGPVREETRLRIGAVAKRLGYRPNSAARTLKTRKTSTLGVLLPDLFGEFFSEVIRGIDQTAQREGYQLLLSSSHGDVGQIEAAMRAMSGRVDGLIVMSPAVDARSLATNLPSALPVVLLNCRVEGDSFVSVNIDNFGGARDVVQHLIGLGHRGIAMIQGAPGNHDSDERLRGYREALQAAGIAVETRLIIPGDFTEAAGYLAARQILDMQPRPSAVFAANDAMAIGALSAMRDAGISVPDEVAVVGFDDIPIARYLSPPLTSVHTAIDGLGARAVEILCTLLRKEGDPQPIHEILPTQLAIRRSCGAGGPAGNGAVDGSLEVKGP
jgi:LacI family transcriptional regulator